MLIKWTLCHTLLLAVRRNKQKTKKRGGKHHRRTCSQQSVSYFTVPPRAHPSAVSPSGSAAPGQTQVVVPSVLTPGGYSITCIARMLGLSEAPHRRPSPPSQAPGTPRRMPAKPACTPGACARTKPCPSSGAFTCSANIDNPNPPLSYTGSSQERRTVLALGARLGASPGATDLRGGSRAPPPAAQKTSPHGQRVGWVQYAHVACARHGAHDPFLMFRPLGHFGSAMRRRSA